ncbi:MAG: hypothetical protein M4579_000331 [Chaenotheca gracillima]|nr:MAG: hypothetical protein M4579_000331 [Chaenotheca gracillima]
MNLSQGSGDDAPPQRFLRRSLRQATLVLPRTGERIKRSVTLRSPSSNDRAGSDEAAAPHGSSNNHTAQKRNAFERIADGGRGRARRAWSFTTSRTGQGILKCSLAYFLGSLATFVGPIASFLGHQDGKHIVATITVYFHPARSQGSMHEAIFLAMMAFVYLSAISFASMGVSVGFNEVGLQVLGHAIVLIVFCGGGLGFVGWLKQRLDNPLVNVACSLASLATITVLTKEGSVQASEFSDDKVQQVMKMVIMGIFFTTLVSLTVKPISASKDLRDTMIKATDSLGDMLSMITSSFLNGSEEELEQPSFKQASDQYKTVFTSLTKNLKEAKYEHYVYGTETEYHIEARLTYCMQRLAQSIGGLRSAAVTQFDLLSQSLAGADHSLSSGVTSTDRPSLSLGSPTSSGFPPERFAALSAIDEVPEEDSSSENRVSSHDGPVGNGYGLAPVDSPAGLFTKFISHLGPSMKSLAYTLKQILDELPFGPAPEYQMSVNSNFRSSLMDAIELFDKARDEALDLVYEQKELNQARPVDVAADFEEVAASCGYFSFSLHDFAEEMVAYLNILEDLKLEVDHYPRHRSWTWLFFWRSPAGRPRDEVGTDLEHAGLIDQNDDTTLPHSPREANKTPSLDGFLSEKQSDKKQAFWYRIWKCLRFMRRDDVKFALKVGMGAALYALPSFIPASRPFYSHWRGEWGLLSYMLVCSMTIGASNTTSFARFFGTCIGAVGAIVAWIVSRGNAFALAALGWLMSLGCFYIIVALGKGPMGRFILLTYNLSALYAYSLSVADADNDDDEGGTEPEITAITLHRVVAVMVGCLWGLFITRVIWPISARRKLKDGLSLLWLRMGLIWKRDPLSILIDGEPTESYMDLREEFELQRFLSSLDNLRKSAASEFELRGPFPDSSYEKILKSTGRMLDAFHAMNIIITKDLRASDGEKDILRYTSSERDHLCTRISHLYQVLASSMKLEYPLNDALPNTENARDRLLARVFDYRKAVSQGHRASDKDFALLYAYALVTGQLSREIFSVSTEIEKLFGALNEDMLKLQ